MKPKIIDLFSGCGGLTLGFEKAGFEIAGGIELVPAAHSTVSFNFHQRYGRPSLHLCGDITQMEGSVFENCIGAEGCIVIGGPPCQAYSMAGRGKLRSLGDHRINTNDSRGYLFQDFLRFVYDLQAKAVVMENVPEATSFGDINVPEIVSRDLSEHGYDVWWTILNSADFGVPQIRERLFVIAVRRDLGISVNLPKPTHRDSRGIFVSSRANTEKVTESAFYRKALTPSEDATPWVTVGEALSDLPSLLKDSKSRYRNHELSEAMSYISAPACQYQDIMRTWYGRSRDYVTANAFRNNTRDFQIFERMNQGDKYDDALRIAEEIFREKTSLFGYTENDPQYMKLHKSIVPCYDSTKFIDKWHRLSEDAPSHTVVAHLSVDTYSHLHPWEPRGISVREAARLQSFPDEFLFMCSMGDAFKQVGNAVPPLLSYAIAKQLKEALK